MKKFLCLNGVIVVLMAACPALFAQPVVKGRVIDRDNRPIAYVTVQSTGFVQAVQTNEAGRFEAVASEIKELAVTFSHAGYIPRTVRMNPGQTEHEIVMTEQAYPMEGVTVTAGRAVAGRSPVTFSSLDRQDIDRHYEIGEVPALLEITPNLYAYSDAGGGLGYSYLSIRGFDARRVPVYINGVPLNDPEDHALYFVDLPDFASEIDDIQVQRGVGNSLYGDAAFGGSINLLTSAMSRPRRFVGEYGYGEFLYNGKTIGLMRKQSASYSSGFLPGGWAISLRWSQQASDGYRRHAWHKATGYFLSLGRVDPRLITTVNIYGGPMVSHAAWWWADRETLRQDRRYNYSTYPNETDNFNQPHLELHNIYRLRDDISFHNSFYYIRGSGYVEDFKDRRKLTEYNFDDILIVYDSAGAPDTLTRVDLIRRKWVAKNQYGINSRVVLQGENHRTAWGGSYYFFDSRHWGEAMLRGLPEASLEPGANRYYEHFGKYNNFSLFASREQQLTEPLSLQGEIQLRYLTIDFHQTRMGVFPGYIYDLDWLFLSPRLGINYRFDSRLSSYASLSITSHEPNDDMVYDANEPDDVPRLREFGQDEVRAERIYDFEIGTVFRTAGMAASANLFWIEYRNEIIAGGLNEDFSKRYVNVDNSVHSGVEIALAWDIGSGLRVRADYAYNDNRVEAYDQLLWRWDPGAADYLLDTLEHRDFPTPGFPRFLSNLIIDYRYGPAQLIYRLRGVGRQFVDYAGDRDKSVAPFAMSSIKIVYGLDNVLSVGRLALEGRIDNLFDKKYEQAGLYDPEWGGYYYLPAAERNWFVNLKLTI